MPMMKSPYDQFLSTTSGHMIQAEADTPVWIPDVCEAQALSCGFKHVAEGDEDPQEDVAAQPEIDDNDDDGDEWAVALDQAILRVITRGDPSDYTAQDLPKVGKVVAEMSPDHRRPTATEIAEAHGRLQENIDLAE